jgi:hypothetical protein
MNDSVPSDAVIEPVDTSVTEPKVKWAAIASAVVALVLAGLPSILQDQDLVAGLPDWVSVLIAILVAGGSTFAAGRKAPHQYRIPEAPKAARSDVHGSFDME